MTTTRTALELKYDSTIPAHLLGTRTALELQAGHHRAMIRFSQERLADFTASLARLEARADYPGRAEWIAATKANIADHAGEIERHAAALAALIPAPFSIAAE